MYLKYLNPKEILTHFSTEMLQCACIQDILSPGETNGAHKHAMQCSVLDQIST